MSVFYDEASLVVVPSGYKSGKIYAQKPLTTDGQLTFTRASTATRVNASGLIETVASGVPRLDYSGGASCPKILLEPQRSNVVLQSQDISTSWTNTNTATLTANIATAPDGTTTADGIQDTTGGTFKRVRQTFSVSANGTHTASAFVKKETTQTNFGGISLTFTGASARYVYGIIDPINGTITVSSDSIIASSSTKVEDYGTYWRFSLTATDDQSNTTIEIAYYGTISTNGTSSGVAAGSVRTVWGFQLEIGASYSSSYIPTTTAAVTRVADAASKTGISSLIGQTEGTLFVEFSTQPEGPGDARISISDGSSANWIFLGKDGTQYRALVRASNSLIYSNIAEDILDSSVVKMAIAYKSGEIAYYFNGILRSSSSSFSFTATLDSLIIGNTNTASDVLEAIKINQLLLFPTRLSNAKLAELTSL
jgi:hypothetical protein